MRYLFLTFIFCVSLLFGFESVEVLNPNIILHKSGYFKTSKELTPQEALHADFTPLPQKAVSFGLDKDTYWFMFEISTLGDEKLYLDSKDIFITTSYDMFVFKNDAFIQSYQNGFVVPIEARDIKTQQIRFALVPNSDKTLYLVRAKSSHPLIPAFSLGNSSELDDTWTTIHEIMLISYFIGIAFLLYNLILFIITKEKAFIYYCIYILGLLLICVTGRSYLPFNLIIDSDILVHLLVVGLSLAVIGSVRFCISFLGLRERFPSLARSIANIGIALLILTPLYYYVDIVFIKIIYLIVLSLLSIFILYAGFKVYKEGHAIGLYFMISTGVGTLFITLFMFLFYPNIVPTNIWSITLVNQALIWDVVALSMALAYRIKLLQEENIKNERLAMMKFREKTIGELSVNIAHQWRLPLAKLGSISANVEAKLKYSEITKEELLEQITLSTTILKHLSETLNTFGQFFQNQKSDKKFSVSNEIQRCIDFVKDSTQYNDIEILFSKKIDVSMNGNVNEFSQVILNILLNAKDILIEKEIKNRYIKIEIKEYKDGFMILISDNGGGIKIKPIESIFESYVTDKHGGTGIGLFIVKTIITQKLNGEIKASNDEDGAVFELKFNK